MKSKRTNANFRTKVLLILSIVLLVVVLFCVNRNNNLNKNNHYYITMLGGSNMEDKGNLNSMGYLIQTANNKLIVVDGGRDIDSEQLVSDIKSIGNGKVDYWFLTHAHNDHIGAIMEILKDDTCDISIENLCYHFNTKDWYEENDPTRKDIAFEFIDYISSKDKNNKIKNIIDCKANDIFSIDNLDCKILRIANPDIKESKYAGNEASMVFKFMMKLKKDNYSDKSMLFLGDSYLETSNELLQNNYNDLKSYAVQMAHHGQDGVSKQVYDAIDPTICFYSCPRWLYDNDNGGGYNSGSWKSIEVREWIEDPSRKTKSISFQAFNGDKKIEITNDGYQEVIN